MAQLKSTNIFGTLKVHALTQSTSVDTGSLVVSGGVGIKKNLNVGGSATILGAVTGLTFNGLTISNSSSTLSLGGNLTTSSHNITLTTSGTTSITLPTSGTLATTGNTETLTNKTISTGSTWNGNIIAISKGGTGLASTTARHALLGPSSAGAPTWRAITVADISDIASALTGITKVGTITTGVWKGTAIANDKLANSSITVGTTNISLGGSSTTLAGLTSVASSSFVGALTGNASTATKLKTTRAIALTGAVTGTANFDGKSDISIATTHTADPVITLTGDVSGSGTMTNLGSVSITATVADDSHNHVIGNIDGLGTALGLKAPLASPTLTGTPVAPTAAKGTKTTQIATTAFVSSAISDLVDSSPEALDTLNELAAALDNDPNFATTVATEIGKKANKVSSPTTGNFAGLSLAGDLTDSGYNRASFTAASHAGATGTAHGAATTSANGFMSSADKSKLDGIAAKANKYSLPTATASVLGGVKIGSGVTITSGVISVSTAYAPSSHVGATGTAHGAATTSANGFMSSDDKTKLNGIATNANKYSLPTATDTTLGGVKTSTGITNSSGTISVAYGTGAGTACQGNDTRLSNDRNPTSHTHGNITNDGKVGDTANLVVVTGTSGAVTTASRSGIDSRSSFPASSHDHDDRYYTENEITAKLALNTPSGIIVMWSGLISAIPTGWFLCNGSNGTPDLRGRFIYGASVDADVETTGGSADAIVVSHTHTGPAHTHTSAAHTHSTPNHAHTASSNSTGAHTHSTGIGPSTGNPGIPSHMGNYAVNAVSTSSAGTHSHTITVKSGGASTTGSTTPGATGSSGTGNTGSTGSSGTNANLPPYMKLAYIMKG